MSPTLCQVSEQLLERFPRNLSGRTHKRMDRGDFIGDVDGAHNGVWEIFRYILNIFYLEWQLNIIIFIIINNHQMQCLPWRGVLRSDFLTTSKTIWWSKTGSGSPPACSWLGFVPQWTKPRGFSGGVLLVPTMRGCWHYPWYTWIRICPCVSWPAQPSSDVPRSEYVDVGQSDRHRQHYSVHSWSRKRLHFSGTFRLEASMKAVWFSVCGVSWWWSMVLDTYADYAQNPLCTFPGIEWRWRASGSPPGVVLVTQHWVVKLRYCCHSRQPGPLVGLRQLICHSEFGWWLVSRSLAGMYCTLTWPLLVACCHENASMCYKIASVRSCIRACVRASVRASVPDYLGNRSNNFSEILHEVGHI